ncbi:CoxG family protein [Arhodomonas sp. AD133]|uniref:CoxG family protein n=1 Tax=Arhodomonas sp. AD133 TaxID=3415009 RepID=UPI003EBFED06
MEMEQRRELPFDRTTVWASLNDPVVLRTCVPGCQGMEPLDEGSYEALVSTRIGPVKARFRGHIFIENARPPEAYRLRFEGQGGAAGFAKGAADVALAETDTGTELGYRVDATVGGKLAQVGSRIVLGAARKLADEFFDNFEAHLRGESIEPATAGGVSSAGAVEEPAAAESPESAPVKGEARADEDAPAETAGEKGGWRFWRRRK